MSLVNEIDMFFVGISQNLFWFFKSAYDARSTDSLVARIEVSNGEQRAIGANSSQIVVSGAGRIIAVVDPKEWLVRFRYDYQQCLTVCVS